MLKNTAQTCICMTRIPFCMLQGKKSVYMRIFLFATLVVLSLIAAGCNAATLESAAAEAYLPTPTLYTYFQENVIGEDADINAIQESTTQVINNAQEGVPPTVASFFREAQTRTPKPTATMLPTLVPVTPDLTRIQTGFKPIFTDTLSSDWRMLASGDISVDPENHEITYIGNNSLAITPHEPFSSVLLAVRPGAETGYLHNEILGISFWLNSGSELVDLDDLAVTVIGSNDYPYWNPDDKSVNLDDDTFFSETRLYYLGLNQSIPPNTWVEVILWLDLLIYDPDYRYITAMYIKNDSGLQRTFYVDEINLITLSQNPQPTLSDTEEQPFEGGPPTAVPVEPIQTTTVTSQPVQPAESSIPIEMTPTTATSPTPTSASGVDDQASAVPTRLPHGVDP